MKQLSMLSAEEVQSQAMGPESMFLSTVHCSASVRAGALPFWPFLETRLLHGSAPFPIPLEEALDWEKGCLGSGSGFMKNWLKDSGWLWQPASVI